MLSYVSRVFDCSFSVRTKFDAMDICTEGAKLWEQGRCWQICTAMHLNGFYLTWAFHAGPELSFESTLWFLWRGNLIGTLKADLLLQLFSWLQRTCSTPHQPSNGQHAILKSRPFLHSYEALYVGCNSSPTKPIKRPCYITRLVVKSLTFVL